MSERRGGSPTAVLERTERPSVDPRLRARRIEVRRREGRRRLRRLLVAVIITVTCAAAWGLTRSPLLDVDHIEVEGANRLGDELVVTTAGVGLGDPLIDIDLDATHRNLAALPWVRSVEVSRSWRGTLRYAIVERSPVAVLASGSGQSMLVDEAGQVLAPATAADLATVVRIEGIDPPDIGTSLDSTSLGSVSLAAALTPGLADWVEAIEVDDAGEHWMRLYPLDASATLVGDEPARVRVGDVREVAAQIIAAETVLARVDLECLGVIDVRVASLPVVTRQPGCGAAA